MEKLNNCAFSRIFKIFVVLLIVISVSFTFTIRCEAVAVVDDVAIALGTVLATFFGGVGVKLVSDKSSDIVDYLYDRFNTYYQTVEGITLVGLASVKDLGISVKNNVVSLGNDIASKFLAFRDLFIESEELTISPSIYSFYPSYVRDSQGNEFYLPTSRSWVDYEVPNGYVPSGVVLNQNGRTFISTGTSLEVAGLVIYSEMVNNGRWNFNIEDKRGTSHFFTTSTPNVENLGGFYLFYVDSASKHIGVKFQYYTSNGWYSRDAVQPINNSLDKYFATSLTQSYDPPAELQFPDVAETLPDSQELTISLPSTFPTVSDATIDADLASASSLIDTVTTLNTRVQAIDISTPADPGAPDISEPIGTLDVFNLRDLGTSFRKLYSALTYSGYDAIWTLPSSGTVPFFDRVFWEEEEIDLNEWINKEEVAPIKAIGGLMLWLSAGFVVFRTLSKTINLFTGGGDDTDD